MQEKFSDVAYQWLKECENKNSPSTVTKYRQLMEKYIIPQLGDLLCQDIDTDKLNKFHDEMLHQDGNVGRLSVSSQRIIIMIVNNVVSYGYKNNLMETELYLKPGLAKKKPLVKVFSMEEQKNIEEYTITRKDKCSFGF